MAVDDLRTRIAKVLYMWYAEDIPYQTETCGDDWESEGESYKDAWRQQADAVIRELGSRLHPGAQEPHRRQMDTSRGVDGLPGVRRMTEPLDAECPICGAGPGQDCRNTIQPGKPLPGRMSHFARAINAWMRYGGTDATGIRYLTTSPMGCCIRAAHRHGRPSQSAF